MPFCFAGGGWGWICLLYVFRGSKVLGFEGSVGWLLVLGGV